MSNPTRYDYNSEEYWYDSEYDIVRAYGEGESDYTGDGKEIRHDDDY